MRLRHRDTQHGIVPPGASLVPDDPQCRLQGHQGLRWTEETERLGWSGTRTRIVAANCTDCGRHQTRVRVVYPPDRTVNVGVGTNRKRDSVGASEGGRGGSANGLTSGSASVEP